MKKLLTVFLGGLLSLAMPLATLAAPLYNTIVDTDLQNLTVTTTGNLQLVWQGSYLQKWGGGSTWSSEYDTGVTAGISTEDLVKDGNNYRPGGGPAEAFLFYNQTFTAKGSGYLEVSIPYEIRFETNGLAAPDGWSTNNDFAGFLFALFNTSDGKMVSDTDGFGILTSTSGVLSNRLFFENGEMGALSSFLYCTAEPIYNTFPGSDSSAPVPEPATILLLGSGLAGVGFIRRKFQHG